MFNTNGFCAVIVWEIFTTYNWHFATEGHVTYLQKLWISYQVNRSTWFILECYNFHKLYSQNARGRLRRQYETYWKKINSTHSENRWQDKRYSKWAKINANCWLDRHRCLSTTGKKVGDYHAPKPPKFISSHHSTQLSVSALTEGIFTLCSFINWDLKLRLW